MIAVTIVESIPPDRKAPNGTSASICPEIDCLNNLSNFIEASSSVPSNWLAFPFITASLTDQ